MRRAAIAWSIALLSAASHGQEMPEDPDRWVRVSVGSFDILTDAGERRALKMADTIQRLTEAIDQATLLETASDRPTLIFAFRRHSALGDLEMARGARGEAIQSYETAIEIDPDHRRAKVGSMTGASTRRIVVTTTGETPPPPYIDAAIKELRDETLRDLENAKTPEERERLQKVLAATNVAEARRAPDLYEEAIRLANAQKIEEALELIEKILSSTTPGTIYHLGALDLKRQIESQR